jgi:hypothetical protein
LSNDDVLARLKRLSNELDAAKTSSEAAAKQVQHAKKITEKGQEGRAPARHLREDTQG